MNSGNTRQGSGGEVTKESATEEGKKWPCEYCTYENWPVAKRCTLCHAPRPPQFITDHVNDEQDIYKMAALVQNKNSDSSAGTGGGTAGTNVAVLSSSTSVVNAGIGCSGIASKWACNMCTFLNWPRSARCMQCLSPRHKASPPQSSPSGDPAKANSLSDVGVGCRGGGGGGRSTPNRSATNSPEPAGSLNNDINRAQATLGKSASSILPVSKACKWSCRVCTYENWPRSAKCILCGIPRKQTLSDSNIHGRVTSSVTVTTVLSPVSVSSTNSKAGRREPSGTAKRQGWTSLTSSRGLDNSERNKQAEATGAGTSVDDSQLKLLRRQLRDKDWLWLNACNGVVDGDPNAIEAFIAAGGNPSRQLTADEVLLLSRPSAFEVGHTLVHLALRFHREDMLAVLLTATDAAVKSVKRLPCHASPDLASDIRRHIASSLRQRKGDFPCFFFSDCVTFALPADIEDLPRQVQELLMDELLDRGVQNELEVEESVINWSSEMIQAGSRLYALWNRTAGDCLLDSILQVTWGVFDADNTLRSALADSLTEGAMVFYPRWKEYESKQAESLHFSLDEFQWQRDWAVLLSLASQPGASLEQTHIFALAHILRRPIIVYGVKYVKSFRGETLGLAKFQGVYLPLLWERDFCWRTPVALAYTRGHFSALVSMETDLDEGEGAGANSETIEEEQLVYLPLVDCEGKLLEVHFLSASEIGREEAMLRDWIDCYETKGGLLVALQRRGRQPVIVKQMLDEWLERYRQAAATEVDPPSRQHSIPTHDFSSDGDSDQE
ncbi:ubiquitin thioesterase Zranb1-like [Littorina saxatilis]|uniref:ubiquitinyl hydrolase 1 n=1 Tax=Littorina saxatilis TaxID=31220 RepID=A0AAN9BTF4_9CAEN